MAQTFFLLDCHTGQPLCFTLSSAAQSVSQATPERPNCCTWPRRFSARLPARPTSL
jgi:hypothetical protein